MVSVREDGVYSTLVAEYTHTHTPSLRTTPSRLPRASPHASHAVCVTQPHFLSPCVLSRVRDDGRCSHSPTLRIRFERPAPIYCPHATRACFAEAAEEEIFKLMEKDTHRRFREDPQACAIHREEGGRGWWGALVGVLGLLRTGARQARAL